MEGVHTIFGEKMDGNHVTVKKYDQYLEFCEDMF